MKVSSRQKDRGCQDVAERANRDSGESMERCHELPQLQRERIARQNCVSILAGLCCSGDQAGSRRNRG
ncbi:MAG TPA: hypothetical protein DC058_15870 [Planctomycetaceae bacterium]|nr:hypothetical protein [Planctomycetaceae bacterium]